MSRHFELLNYSEHGTTVDNVLYSCDFSDKPATTPQPSPIVAAVREIIAKGRPKGSKKKSKHAEAEKAEKIDLVEKPKMSAKAQDVRFSIVALSLIMIFSFLENYVGCHGSWQFIDLYRKGYGSY